MKPSTCLVTGVAGFVGSHLAERLLRDGHTVIGVDRFSDYYPRWMKERNLAGVLDHQRFHFVEGDLLDLDLEGLLQSQVSGDGRWGAPVAESVSYVFHLAAQAGVRQSWGDSFETYLRDNVLATQRLLEAAKGQPLRKLVYASSSSIYGDAEAFPTPEDVTPHPVSPYGVTKLAAEHLCLLYWRNYGVPAVGLRYFTVYGPGQRPDMAFNIFIRAILDGREIKVFGDGLQTRDFTFVDDAVEGTVQAGYANAVGEVYNLGGGSRVSVNQVIRELEQITRRKALVRYSEPSRGDVRHTSADTTKAAAQLGYAPSTSLAEGLRHEVAWLKTARPQTAAA